MKKRTIIIIVLVLIITLLSVTMKFPTSIKTKGKLLSHKTWVLSKGSDGRLITYLTDNLTGITSTFGVTQFERGDAVQFNMKTDLLVSKKVEKGDTIGSVISNEIEKDIEKLQGELETTKALLAVQTSSEKESIIEVERNRLDFAKKELEEQKKIYNREKLLYEKQLISLQDFEAVEARYELAKINISIADERLKTVQSGAKKEEIDLLNSQIKTIENEIGILRSRFERNNVISPIDGMILRPFSSDTLLIVNDTSRQVILIPTKWSESMNVFLDQEVVISSPYVGESINAKVYSIDNSVKTIDNQQYVIVTAVAEEHLKLLKMGLYVECSLKCPEKTLFEMVYTRIKLIFN